MTAPQFCVRWAVFVVYLKGILSGNDIAIVAESRRSAEQKDRFGNIRLSVSRRNPPPSSK
uniref:Uncharacterized protein n=1 Tax=Setaria digitata TaxID=48799 RepID=A0A915Q583_9BILA